MASFNKVTYVDNETVIHAANLNAIQDSTLQNEADIDTLESGKVDKVTGKGLSTNDFTTEQLTKLSNLPTGAELETSLAGKVPTTRKINNKALSADITLGAGDIGYDDTATYGDDTVGKNLKAAEGDIDELQTAIATKAEIDGSYESMTVGNAEQLVATVGVEDKVPYNFRTSGGSADIGDREVDEIVGGTIAWNQQIRNGNFSDVSGWNGSNVTKSASDSIMTYTISTVSTANQISRDQFHTTVGHKYIAFCDVYSSKNTTCRWQYSSIANGVKNKSVSANTWETVANVFSCISDNGILLYYCVSPSSLSANDTIKFRNFMCIDLTQMFGSTIADYMYDLEQANAGAGVAWFRKLFPKPYYAYNTGTLLSVNTSAHEMTGFNQWDEEWEKCTYNSTTGAKETASASIGSKNFIPVIPKATYYFRIDGQSSTNPYFYDADKNYIGRLGTYVKNGTFVVPENANYMNFALQATYGATYLNDICFNLSWDGERDGEYEPYEKHTYPLDSSLTLRGVPKLDADSKLYYDGDTYESDGTVTRKYGIVDLGTLGYSVTASGLFMSNSLLGTIKNNVSGAKSVLVCPLYDPITASITGPNGSNPSPNMTMAVGTAGTVYFNNTSYVDKDAFKTAMSGVYLVYELATSTTETADPYQNPQKVDDFGTEEYVDAGVTASTPTRDVAIPVGHVTQFQANLRAKLEMAPDSPDGDGDYIVRQTNGENSYVPITFPADELPAAPTTDGNYVLKCTVSSGTATFTWASA